MGEVYIMWGDWLFGRLINMLPARPSVNDEARMVQPMVVEIEPAVQKWLGIDLRVEGVDKFGKPGGFYIKVECYVDDVLAPVPLQNGSYGHFVVTNFNGGPSVITRYVGHLKELNNELVQENNSLKALVKTCLSEMHLMSSDVQTGFKVWKDTITAAKIFDDVKPLTEDESKLEGGGE